MLDTFKTDSNFFKTGAILLTAFAVIACSGAETGTAASTSGSAYEVAGDHAIGNPDAKATIVEYASVTCGACANWHTTVYPDFKKKYIDTGKVRFVFREFPTAPENLARAGFLIANCANEDKFFENISLQFKRQASIFAAAQNGTVRNEYIAIAKSAGLSEAEFEACLVNEDELERYQAVIQGGIDAGVTGTPSFFLNGEKLSRVFTIEQFDEKLLPILGEAATASSGEAPTDPTE